MPVRTARPTPASRIADLLGAGVRAHQAGRLEEAEAQYRAVLALDGAQVDALHLLGLAAHHRGQHAAALELVGRAVAQRPDFGPAQSTLGNVLLALGDFRGAIEAHGRALQALPGDAEVLHNLGNALAHAGAIDEAVATLRRALEARPAQHATRLLVARVLLSRARWAEGEAELLRVVVALPEQAEPWTLLGTARLEQGKLDGAAEAYTAALRLAPGTMDAESGLGVIALRGHRPEEARARFEAALRLAPDSALNLANLAAALRVLDRHEEALPLLERAVARDPANVLAHCNLGAVLLDRGAAEAALACFDTAAHLAPRAVEPLANRAVALADLGRYPEAIGAAEQALATDPRHPGARTTLGRCLGEMGRAPEAIAACRTVLAQHPDWAEAHWNLALPLLRTGEYLEGWREYEWRFRAMPRRMRRAPTALPHWGGEPLAGRTLLVYHEQGFGDTLHFARYLPLLAARGARVLFQVQGPLRRLYEGFPGVTELVPADASGVRADWQVALVSLPHLLGTTLPTIPPVVPLAELPCPAHLRLPATGRLRVGFAWGGSPLQTNNQFRSIPLHELLPLLRTPGVDAFSLQVGATPDETAQLAALPGVTDLAPALGDFADTAAVMRQLDLVITVDTSVAHLAGTLGRPAWVLLAHTCCWRYLLDRSDSPWYPTARLFRQPRRGAWLEVVAALRTALKDLVP